MKHLCYYNFLVSELRIIFGIWLENLPYLYPYFL